MAGKFKKPTDLVQEDLLLRFTVQLQGGTCVMEHYIVTAVAFQGGNQKPMQSYIKLDAANGNEDGLVLRLFSSPHVAPRNTEGWPSPIDRAETLQAGSLVSLSTTQLAAHLVQLDTGALDPQPPVEIGIQRCKYDDVSRSTIKVTGLVDDWEKITISGRRDPGVVGALGFKGKGKGKSKGKNPKSEIDFLDFLDMDLDCPKGPRGRNSNSCPTVEQSRPADSMDAVGIREELLSQLLDAFDVPVDKRMEGEIPKWQEDFQGLFDADQLEALQAAHDASELLNTSASEPSLE